ncbi:SusC/RagA family TonB-linked outer membrane protein [Sesbania bispinosa]|nr:SusC/RagA family TonB-linked outer membrane protein [Sesbania bispinosa]
MSFLNFHIDQTATAKTPFGKQPQEAFNAIWPFPRPNIFPQRVRRGIAIRNQMISRFCGELTIRSISPSNYIVSQRIPRGKGTFNQLDKIPGKEMVKLMKIPVSTTITHIHNCDK